MKAPITGFNVRPYPLGHVTQYFGENPELYSRVVCKDDNGTKYCLDGHNGIDIVAPHGTPIFAVEGGKIVNRRDSATGYGKHVKVLNLDTGHEWVYGHLSRIDVDLNDTIEEGTQIGLMGNTGFVISGDTPYWKHNPYAGTHLHLGLRNAGPYKKGSINTTYHNGERAEIKDWRNGFFGAVSWIPLWKQSDAYKRPLQLTIISLANEVIALLDKLIALKK